MAGEQRTDYRTALIDIADKEARLTPEEGARKDAGEYYFRKFRAAYRWMALAVETSGHTSQMAPVSGLLEEAETELKKYFGGGGEEA